MKTMTEGVELVERGGFLVPVAWEDLIDAGLGTPEMIAWDQARTRNREARWRTLPLHVRAWRRTATARYELRQRLGHAVRALRGIECEP